MKAFLPGAGLGTRLRPLTAKTPKPLVSVFNRPLIEWGLDACISAGATEFAINTHHCPDRWEQAFPDGQYRGLPITFFHEPMLLETGGGLKNIEGWIGSETLLVYNGDILSEMDLLQLVDSHHKSASLATLALRSQGPAKVVEFDSTKGQVVDLRGQLGIGSGTHQFTGIYCIEPGFLDFIPADEIISARQAMIECARRDTLAGVVLDEGQWLDLGTPDTYLRCHLEKSDYETISPEAEIDNTAVLSGRCWVGQGASVGASCQLHDCVVWPGVTVTAGTEAKGQIFHD